MLPARVRQRRAELNWRRGPLQSWVRDRAASAEVTTTAPVLGTTAQVFQYEGGSAGDRDITALWSEDGGVLEKLQIAIGSRLFRPGPLSWRDDRVHAFDQWVLNKLPVSARGA